MREILLTGAKGQLGREIVRRAAKAGTPLKALGREAFDVTLLDNVMDAFERDPPALVVNAAAYTAVDDAESERANAFAVNCTGARNLARACAHVGAPLIHISSDYVFDGAAETPYTEDQPTAPINVYGQSKQAGEDAVRDMTAQHVILRSSWIFGLDGANFVKTILEAGRHRDELQVVDDQFGSPTYAGDLAEVILDVARRLTRKDIGAHGFGTFHCAGGGGTSWHNFTKEIYRISAPHLPRQPKITPVSADHYAARARRPVNSVLDCAKLDNIYGIKMRPWAQGLTDMLRHYFQYSPPAI